MHWYDILSDLFGYIGCGEKLVVRCSIVDNPPPKVGGDELLQCVDGLGEGWLGEVGHQARFVDTGHKKPIETTLGIVFRQCFTKLYLNEEVLPEV